MGLRIDDYGSEMDVMVEEDHIGSLICDEDEGYEIEVFVDDVLTMVGFNHEFLAAIRAILLLNDVDESLISSMVRVGCEP